VVGESSHPLHQPEDRPAAQPLVDVPFERHVDLVKAFLARRAEIVERIAELLNAQRKPSRYTSDIPELSRRFEECFFRPAELTDTHLRLKLQLEEAHWASGFKPRQTPDQHNDLIDPAELIARAFLMWQRTRWPGYRGRVLYAHTLFNVYLLRRLMLLAMRLWDAGSPSDRLAQVQGVLDDLWRTSPADQPLFVRDARWLLPLAQSPTTDQLHGYFVVAERIAATLAEQDRLEVCSASVRMAGGHLRSQLRHVSTQQGVPIDEHSLVLTTRRSNALDLATLIQALVPLLEAYKRAVDSGDSEQRIELCDAICQGVSPDPELFLNRLDLLGPYSMIEHLFITRDRDGFVGYTPMGQRHLRIVREYAALLGDVSKALRHDCPRFRPVDAAYSPYGVLYGFSSRLLEHMALKATCNAVTRFSLEDVFVGGDVDKLEWVSGWRKLPHVPREVVKLFEYPQQFAIGIFARIENALHKCADGGEASPAAPSGRLFVLSENGPQLDPLPSWIPDLPSHFVFSSDRQVVAANKAIAYDETQLLHSALEGEFLVSYPTSGGWAAVTKDVLTDVLGVGRNVKIVGLPRDAANAAKLMCPEMVVLASETSELALRQQGRE
jgi:hypothetical protein